MRGYYVGGRSLSWGRQSYRLGRRDRALLYQAASGQDLPCVPVSEAGNGKTWAL